MATLTLNQLTKTYANGYQALKGIDLDIKDGEFVVIVGPSGCGKSTLLRIVAGLEDISTGDLLIDGQRVNDVSASKRDIAMVFQNYALYPHMTVFDNMAYGLKIRKVSKDDIKKLVNEAAQILGLSAVLDRKPQQLSGGQRQRVAMGRAIVRSPKIFLFDEPLSNLDAKLRVQMRLEMQTLHQRLKTTSLYVTHDQVEAMTLAEKIVLLNGGQIEQVGTPDEIYHQPASVFVAHFIGSPPMNLLNMTRHADQWLIKAGDMVLNLTVTHQLDQSLKAISQSATHTSQQDNFWLGIRPEHLRLYPQGNAVIGEHELCLEGRVHMQELLGAERLVYVKMGNETVIVRCGNDDITAQQLTTGQPCQLVCERRHLYWFDDLGKRLIKDQ